MADYYEKIINLTQKTPFSRLENDILNDDLITPLKTFLFSLDKEFGTTHFYDRIGTLKRGYIKVRNRLSVKVVDSHNKPAKKITVIIYSLEFLAPDNLSQSQWLEVIKGEPLSQTVVCNQNTDKFGIVSKEFTEGAYKIEIQEFNIKQICDLKGSNQVTLKIPKAIHWWNNLF